MPILMYHHVGSVAPPGYEKYSLTPARFARQLGWLRRLGYRDVTLDRLIAGWALGTDSGRAVAITFDDGYRDCLEHAAPVLARSGMTATFFLVSGEMGRVGRWLLRDRGVALPIMSWGAARELAQAGFAIGAHSVTHPRLAAIERQEVRRELHDSRTQIEDELGRPVKHFAYPYGSHNEAVAADARAAGYESACTTDIGLAASGHDRWTLPRVPVDGREPIWDFVARVKTGHPVRDLVRRASSRSKASR